MTEWRMPISEELAQELEMSFITGPIINDAGLRNLSEQELDRFGGLKIEVFSNEHPPPPFRVCYQGMCNNFTISDCVPMNGDGLSNYFRNIKKWHKKNKKALIDFWNEKQPTDCPVGKYDEK